ncbi:3-oxosteroid 1-dehydrogenase [Crossiella sp. CA-258035]|uniref:3-oxosteroid 1-dehydrogenase n=1 Tax=Crossiella sp. CA-258035 TaxID=2981138 RepID=UPI0024BCEDA1|nr:3-oxosteroid 1-dehydrogenase [Crossiella sp. CA-258035]WHT18438.1 3-oxosteroid 1-dehydrogenase [Crossiella sp. CA-258035]
MATAEFDVVVVGAGAAGMTAALTAAKRGLRAVVLEKAAVFGGSMARSGAAIWIPNNEVLLAAGVPDTPEKAAAYLARVVGDIPVARQRAYLANGPAMLSFLQRNSPLKFTWMEGYSDYYPEFPGGIAAGRSIEPQMIDGRILGAELANLNPPYMPTPPATVVYGVDYKWLTLIARHPRGVATASATVARGIAAGLAGQKPLTMGGALAGGLRAGLMNAGVPVWLNTPLLDLHVENGRVIGVVAQRNGAQVLVKARRGVIVGSGGFEHNERMRKEFQEEPIGTSWSVGAKANTGAGIEAGQRIGAAMDLLDDAWWGPAIPLPEGPYFCLSERTLPGCILVNGAGKRFVNEAAPYSDVVHVMYEKDEPGASHIPAWLISDQQYRNRYLFKDIPPLLPLPQAWFDSGAMAKADSIESLAARIGIQPVLLRETVNRFNGFARAGRDLDFKRGDSAYDHYYADPTNTPNACLAPIEQGPFYAMKIVPGDLGTKGGMRTDARARVLRPDGSVIPGLWASGNCTGAVMGRSYAGAGSTLGPAMTFGYVAANDLADTPAR